MSPLMDGPDSFGTSPLRYNAYRGFGYRGSRFEGERFSGPLVSPMPKRRSIATCPSDGRRQLSAQINGRDIFGMINGHDQVPTFLNRIHTSCHFGVSVIRISQVAKTRVLSLWFPGCQNAEALNRIHVYSIDGRSKYFHGSWGLRSRFLRYS
jgi:hypothetical protein